MTDCLHEYLSPNYYLLSWFCVVRVAQIFESDTSKDKCFVPEEWMICGAMQSEREKNECIPVLKEDHARYQK